MTEPDRTDLRALRPDPGTRDRVIAGAMARVREPSPGFVQAALEGSARFLRPALAAAVLVLLFALLPGRSPHPDLEAAGVLLSASADVSDPLVQWSIGEAEADPRAVLVMYGRGGP